jgi:hypothetical protein
MATLKERLGDWHDWDTAAFEVGACLGFWGDFGAPPGEDPWWGTKGVFWSNNPLGTALHTFVLCLVKSGMLEADEDKLAFRWNPNYKEEIL